MNHIVWSDFAANFIRFHISLISPNKLPCLCGVEIVWYLFNLRNLFPIMANIDHLQFVATGKEQRNIMILMVVGLVLALVGVFLNIDNPTRIWTALLYNTFFTVGIALAATFFISANTQGYGGWYIMFRRVMEAMSLYLPVGGILLLVVVFLGMGHIYHWLDPSLTDPASPHYDKILAGKSAYLNKPFFLGRIVVYVTVWSAFAWLLRRNSLEGDKGYNQKLYQNSKYIAALFIVFFAVSESMVSWDLFMSIQPHWYSTLWGWYNFISYFVTGMSVTYLLCAYLKTRGYLPYMTDEHFHDIGKFMFGFSIAWTYLYFSQFMLIWYSNMPEETKYFEIRNAHYPVLMWFTFILNFITPFLILVTRGAKRNFKVACTLGGVIIFGHWMDFFQMSMPGALHNMSHGGHEVHFNGIGLLEIGIFCFYIGLFLFVFFRNLAAAPMLPINHPFVKESFVHHT